MDDSELHSLVMNMHGSFFCDAWCAILL